MSSRDLDAAGIVDTRLRSAYEECRRLNALHGKTYYLATLLLPPAKRPYVHALYGFARYADEIVDDLSSTLTIEQKTQFLANWSEEFLNHISHPNQSAELDDVQSAVAHTIQTWNIPTDYFKAFLHSMAMDLTVTEYETFDDLMEYVYGSASVIGLQMVPILEPTHVDAYKYAEKLGVAFQLANFIRDLGEDLERGRVYLPMQDFAQFGVTRADLEKRIATPAIKEALKFQIARVRQLEEESRLGIPMLNPSAQPCIQTARVLYCGIVDAVEAIDYEIFAKRASVSLSRRLAVAVPAYLKARKLWKTKNA